MRGARARATAAAALLFPPVVVLASVHDLYLRNQGELDRCLSVLHPFWAAAAAAVLLGGLLRLSRCAVCRGLLAGYYSAGLAFLAWSFLRGLPFSDHLARWTLDTTGGAAAFACAAVAAAAILARGDRLRRTEPAVALIAILLVGGELAAFAVRLDRRPPGPVRDLPAELARAGNPRLPNVYHLILDAFQRELLEPCLDAALRRQLDGFVGFELDSFSNATAAVLPALLSGRNAGEGRADERLSRALRGSGSLVPRLRAGGYLTVGFVPRFLYPEAPAVFDLSVFHDENARGEEVAGLQRAFFRRLWAVRVLPLALSESLARSRLLAVDPAMAEGRSSTFAQPVVSLLTMERLLRVEPALPARGRYTLVHLLLPHNPHLLRSDCSFTGMQVSDLRQQTECTLLLVDRFLALLRRLGRLEDAVVLIHGDHGSGQLLVDRRLVPGEAEGRHTVLLVHAPGARGPLRDTGRPARIVDVAPTLLALAGVGGGGAMEGRPLLPAGERTTSAER